MTVWDVAIGGFLFFLGWVFVLSCQRVCCGGMGLGFLTFCSFAMPFACGHLAEASEFGRVPKVL